MATEAKGQRVNINGTVTDVLFKDAEAREQLANIGKTIYPVGSIYISVTDTSPAALFGGTWERLKDRFLLAAGDTYANGSTGGEATHTLTVDEIPKHRHTSDSYMDGYAKTAIGTDKYVTWVNFGSSDNNNNGSQTGENGPVRTSWVGGSKPHNNMPPYLAVYAWKRVE